MNKKRMIWIIGILLIVLAMGGYWITYNKMEKKEERKNPSVQREDNAQVEKNENTNKKEESNKKIAIIYFSATGTTKTVAEYIKEETKGDIFQIAPKEKYTADDLSYNNSDSRATKEQKDAKARPEMENRIDVSDYDVVFIGYPIWWGDVPRIIQTFIENTNLSGKTVIPFCTSGSSGIETSENTLHSYDNNINWGSGKRLGTSKSEVTDWINHLEL